MTDSTPRQTPGAAPTPPVEAATLAPAAEVGNAADAAPDPVAEPARGTDPAGAEATPLAQPAAPTLWEQMGGPMGMLDSGLPVVVFVIVELIAGLGWGIGAALAAGVIIAVLRLVRRKPVTQAIGGLFAVGVAAFIAGRTHSAKGYFLFGIWSYVLYGGLLLISILVRWPLIGALWEGVNGRGTAWRRDKRLVHRYDWATVVWVVVFAARFAVQNQLYDANQVGWLATARLLMGYPVYLLAVLATILIVGSANGMKLPSWLSRKSGRAEPHTAGPEHGPAVER